VSETAKVVWVIEGRNRFSGFQWRQTGGDHSTLKDAQAALEFRALNSALHYYTERRIVRIETIRHIEG
jgi:hypothetical protein